MSGTYEKPLRGIAKYSSGKVDMELDANSHRLVQMMYESILEKLAIAKGCIDRKDDEAKMQINTKLQLIFVELRKSLNFKLGGEISVNLDNLYEYCGRRTAFGIIGNDKKVLDEVIDLISIVKDSWDKIEDQAESVLEELEKTKENHKPAD